MNEEWDFPRISTELELTSGNLNHQYYSQLIPSTLKQILPPEFIELYRQDPFASEEHHEYFQSLLPFTYWTEEDAAPSNMSFYLVTRYRPNAFKFFFEMISIEIFYN